MSRLHAESSGGYESKKALASHLASIVLDGIKQRESEWEQTERFTRNPARKLEVKEAISVLYEQAGAQVHQLDSFTSEQLIKELARAKGGSAELALAMLDEMVSQSSQSSSGPSTSGRVENPVAVGKGAYDAALSACCTQLFGAVAAREALRVYELMPAHDRDVGSCNLAISACSHWGDLRGVMIVVDDMVQRGIVSNDFTMRSALQACMYKRKGGMHETAVELVKKLSSMSSAGGKQGQRLSSEVVDALLLVCEAAMDKAGSLEGAEAAFQALGSLPGRLHHSQRAYNSLLRACARQGKWQAAQKYFELMIEQGVAINTESFNSLIRAALKGSALTVALEVFEQLVSGKGVADPIFADMETYNLLIMTCHQAGMLEKALEIASWADRSGFKFNKTTYDELVGTAEIAEIWDRKAIRDATDANLAVFPHHLRPSQFESLRLSYLDHLPELNEEESLAITKLRDKSWAPTTLTKGKSSPGLKNSVFSPRTIAAMQNKLPGLDRSLYPSSPSPVFSTRSGKAGSSSPVALSRLPSFNSNIAAAVDKAAEVMVGSIEALGKEEAAVAPVVANDPRLHSGPQHRVSNTGSITSQTSLRERIGTREG